MNRSIDQQIAETTNKLQRLKSKKKTRDTRLKIVVGASIIAEAKANPEAAHVLLKALQTHVTRAVDQKEIAALIEHLSNPAKEQTPHD